MDNSPILLSILHTMKSKIAMHSALGFLFLLTISCEKDKNAIEDTEADTATADLTDSYTSDSRTQSGSNNLALGKKVIASSTLDLKFPAENAVDGKIETYWSSEFKDDAWLAVNLGKATKVSRVNVVWEFAHAKAFLIQISTNGEAWTQVYDTAEGKGGTNEIKFPATEALYIRLVCRERSTQWGNAVIELEVFE
jgi:hypothetical protein